VIVSHRIIRQRGQTKLIGLCVCWDEHGGSKYVETGHQEGDIDTEGAEKLQMEG